MLPEGIMTCNRCFNICYGLSTATIEYSCPSVCLCSCLSVCVCVSVYVHDNSKNNASIHLKLEHIVVYGKLEHIVVYGNSSDIIGLCPIKVKITA